MGAGQNKIIALLASRSGRVRRKEADPVATGLWPVEAK